MSDQRRESRNEPEPSDQVSARVQIRIGGADVAFTLTVPTAPVGPEALLPIARGLAETAENVAVEAVRRAGRAISCRKGCGACCRQLVPISPLEAHRLADLVATLPEPRRSEVRARFDEAIRRLGEVGMLDGLRDPESIPVEDRKRFVLDYFHQGIPCPFLEDESCSIHPERPLVCREYLVTSPAENCRDPSPETIDRVKIPLKLSGALRQLAGGSMWVPLVLSLEYAGSHPLPTQDRPGPEWVQDLFRLVSGRDIPPPPGDLGADGHDGTGGVPGLM